MTERSARHLLPFILPGQAQKEAFHNEALAAIDGLLHPAAEGFAAIPPAHPESGQAWLVAAGAGGAWAGHDQALAVATDGGWRFHPPRVGMAIWDSSAGLVRRWTGTAWSEGSVAASALMVGGQQVVASRQPAVPSPSGGTTIDVEARAALEAIIVTLKSHGLID